MSLVLGRRVGEAILCETPQGLVRISIIETRINYARVRIEAPPELLFWREELCEDGIPQRQPKGA
jgi:sRNA-binding carbon storage regulator CsrA